MTKKSGTQAEIDRLNRRIGKLQALSTSSNVHEARSAGAEALRLRELRKALIERRQREEVEAKFVTVEFIRHYVVPKPIEDEVIRANIRYVDENGRHVDSSGQWYLDEDGRRTNRKPQPPVETANIRYVDRPPMHQGRPVPRMTRKRKVRR